MDAGINDIQPPGWNPGCPTRAAVDFLELALTNGHPNSSYGDLQESPVMSEGSRTEGPTLTLPLEGPNSGWSSPNMLIPETAEHSNPEPELGPLSFDGLSLMVVDDIRDALLSPPDHQNPDATTNTTSDRSLHLVLPRPRPGMPPLRPQPNGILRLDCSIRTRPSSPTTGMGDVIEQRSDDGPNGSQRPNKSQLPHGAADLAPPEVVEAPPKRKRIIKIKSRAAVLYLRGLNNRETEANFKRRIASGEARPPSDTAQFDEAAWQWDDGFAVPGDNSQLKESR